MDEVAAVSRMLTEAHGQCVMCVIIVNLLVEMVVDVDSQD